MASVEKGDKRGNKDGKRDAKKPSRNQALYDQWEKELEVTLETQLPQLPKDKLEEPSNKELREKLQGLDKDLNAKREEIAKLKVKKAESIEKGRKERDENKGSMSGLFNQAKAINNEISALNEEKKHFEVDIEKLTKQKDAIVKTIFGKKIMKATQCEERIEELSRIQRTDRLTATEERAILKDLKELENSLPLIQEADAKDQEMKEVKDKKRTIGKKMHELIEGKNKLNAQIDEAKAEQKLKEGDKVEGETKKEDRPKHPVSIEMDGVFKKMDE